MNDARLKALYRRLSAPADATLGTDELVGVLSRTADPERDGTPLDRIAASAVHADLLRTALQLEDEAAGLSRDVARLQAAVRPAPARRWLAVAAGVGAAALLVVALRPGAPPAPGLADGTDRAADETILAVSFEAAAQDTILAGSFESQPGPAAASAANDVIFDADFDS